MNRISRNLAVVYKTERLIARRRLAVVQKQTVMMGLAGVFALVGLVLANAALYLLFERWISPAAAAAILALANVILAFLLVRMANRMTVDDEIAPALEVRDLALAELEAEVEDATQEVRQVVDSVKSLPRDPFGSLVTLLIPVLRSALKK